MPLLPWPTSLASGMQRDCFRRKIEFPTRRDRERRRQLTTPANRPCYVANTGNVTVLLPLAGIETEYATRLNGFVQPLSPQSENRDVINLPSVSGPRMSAFMARVSNIQSPNFRRSFQQQSCLVIIGRQQYVYLIADLVKDSDQRSRSNDVADSARGRNQSGQLLPHISRSDKARCVDNQ